VIHKKLSLFHYFHLIAFLVFISFAIIFFSLSVYKAKQKFNEDVRTLQETYVASQKALLEKEVNHFIEHINQKRQAAYATTQALVRTRVYEAYDLATKMYEKYKGKLPDSQIQSMIIETLRLYAMKITKAIISLHGLMVSRCFLAIILKWKVTTCFIF